MAINLDHPVIGVFGSAIGDESVHDAVKELAKAIHRAGAVLLTGAEPPDGGYPEMPEPRTVKDLAVHALRDLTSEQETLWIGVGRHHKALPPKRYGAEGIVVTPGWDHRRNFVEAAICDAAFAVGATSAGTASEVLFCLYLRRPVTVVGCTPGAVLSAATLKGINGTRVQPNGKRRSVDVGVARALAWADTTDSHVTTVALPKGAEADTLVRNLKELLPRDRRRWPLEELTEKDGWDRYLRTQLEASRRC